MRKLERRTSLPLLLLALFLSYNAGISLFAHTHVVNGAPIVHSHPFAKSTHSHSNAQVIAFNYVGHFQSVAADLVKTVSAEWHELYEMKCCRDNYHHLSVHISGLNLRAPPCC